MPYYLNIGDVWEHDLFLSFDVDSGDREFRLYGGVNNLFNSISPFLPPGTHPGRLTNQNGVYANAGRRFYIGATVKFCCAGRKSELCGQPNTGKGPDREE